MHAFSHQSLPENAMHMNFQEFLEVLVLLQIQHSSTLS